MPRTRAEKLDWETAAAEEEQGSGCFSALLLPPLAVLLVGCLLAFFVSGLNIPPQGATFSTPAPLADNLPTTTVGLAPFFTPEVQYWGAAIHRWAEQAGLDPNLVAVVMQIESCGDPLARSRAGAMGLFQVMPFHFARDENPYDVETNARRGLNYLARAWQAAHGDPRLTLAGYNGGISVISRGEIIWSAETQRYVSFGAAMYEDAQRGFATSPALEEWYQQFGAGLCHQAHQRLGLP